MVVIHLYGILEQAAQRIIELESDSFDDSMRGLFANFPKLKNIIRDMRLSILVNGEMIKFEDCLRPMKAERIDIVPVVGGAGPLVMVVVGAMLNYGAATIAGMFAGTMLGSVITAAAIAQFGLSMIIGGISQLLFKPPKPNIGSRAEDRASYNFNGAVNVTQQGNIVPVGYGRLRVGSMVVSVNVQTFDIVNTPTTEDDLPAPPTIPEGPYYVDGNDSGDSPGTGVGDGPTSGGGVGSGDY